MSCLRPIAKHAAVAACVLFSACAGPAPDLRLEPRLKQATGTAGLLVFHTEGEPLDVPSASAAVPDALPLPVAVERALRHAPELQQALAEVQVAAADADQARLFANPVLGVVWRWGNGPLAFEASLTESIVQVLTRGRRADAADRRLEAAACAALATALDVMAETQTLYATAQSVDVVLPLAEARVRALARLVEVADSRLRGGEGTQQERVLAQSRRFQAERELEALRRERREARVQLARRLGEPSGSAVWTLDAFVAVDPAVEPEARWVASALEARPELQAVRFELGALGDDAALARWSPFEISTIGAETQRTPIWFTGPNAMLPLPVFDTGAVAARGADARVVAARHRLVGLARTVVAEVRVLHGEVQNRCAELVRVRDEHLPAQARVKELAEAAMRAGQTDVSAVLDAEQQWLAAKAAAVELEREARLARIRLRRAVGGVAAESASDGIAAADVTGGR